MVNWFTQPCIDPKTIIWKDNSVFNININNGGNGTLHVIKPPIAGRPKTFQKGWILNGQRIWQQLKDVFLISHIWTKLFGISFIIAHPPPIFQNSTYLECSPLTNISLSMDLVASFPHIRWKGIGFGSPCGNLGWPKSLATIKSEVHP